jgi:hypothetical protein
MAPLHLVTDKIEDGILMASLGFAPDALFAFASKLAMAGWLVLVLSIIVNWRIGRDLVAGLAVPLALSVGYTALILVHWSSAKGGFSSLADVALLFESRWMLLAGWVHFLAFDLFLGAWIARDAATNGISRWLVLPVMPLTLMFGPAGFVMWIILKTANAPIASR